jgi:hypothetical protein
MNDVLTQDQLSVPYNPNLLVTYKYVNEALPSDVPTFMTDKVTEIEYELHRARSYADAAHERRKDISWLEDQISEWYDPNYDKEDVLRELANHFNINPMKEMSVYGTVSFSGTIKIPIAEIEDFDLSNVTIDAELSSYDYDADLTVDEVSLEEN